MTTIELADRHALRVSLMLWRQLLAKIAPELVGDSGPALDAYDRLYARHERYLGQ